MSAVNGEMCAWFLCCRQEAEYWSLHAAPSLGGSGAIAEEEEGRVSELEDKEKCCEVLLCRCRMAIALISSQQTLGIGGVDDLKVTLHMRNYWQLRVARKKEIILY